LEQLERGQRRARAEELRSRGIKGAHKLQEKVAAGGEGMEGEKDKEETVEAALRSKELRPAFNVRGRSFSERKGEDENDVARTSRKGEVRTQEEMLQQPRGPLHSERK
jgi:hypothetical protein